MAVSVPIVAAVITAVGGGIEMNQQKQAAKGAANTAKEQQDRVNLETEVQKKKDAANLNLKQNTAGASQQAALAAIRASMSAGASSGGTILTGPSGSPSAPGGGKTLLGV